MVKKFTRIMDPERVKDGDLLVFPAGETRLNLKPSTWGGLGLSMGGTCRSDNSENTVSAWLSRTDFAARLFMICGVSHRSAPCEEDLLLTMDACVRRKEPEVPLVCHAALVPFGPKLWPAGKWISCWDRTHGGAVLGALAERAGVAGAIADRNGRAKACEDMFMNQVWDGDVRLSKLDVRAGEHDYDDAECWFPVLVGKNAADESSYDVSTLAQWRGGWDCKDERIRFHGGFMTNLAKRGALLLRPTPGFERLVTESCVSRWCLEMQKRFARRAAAGRDYLKGLAADIRRDVARQRMYGALSRKAARLGPRLARKTLKETGVSI